MFRIVSSGLRVVTRLQLPTAPFRPVLVARNLSSSPSSPTESIIPPVVDTTLLESTSNVLAEPSFVSLGLSHGYPSGMIQAIMEVVHVNAGLTWWATIAATTVSIRLILLPVMISVRKNAVKLNHVEPQLQQFQLRNLKVKAFSDEEKKLQQEMAAFIKEKQVHPFLGHGMMLCQAAVFASMFFGIRGMANLPVESMKTGGMGWFTDLTVADPIMLLPILTCASLFVNIKIGADGVDPNQMPKFMRNFLLAIPFLTFPVMISFPAALNVYWLTTNVVSVSMTVALSQKRVREYFGILEMKTWPEKDLPMRNANPFTIIKEARDKSIQDRILEERRKEDEKRQKDES